MLMRLALFLTGFVIFYLSIDQLILPKAFAASVRETHPSVK